MSDIAIKVENLSKLYRIGKRERYRALRDTLTSAMYAPFRRIRSVFGGGTPNEKAPEETIWALKDVSFEIPRGEVVGIIGRNGAGKSTLLKILSRITEPSGGYAEIRGRVGSLLEVGTGFHPELTGRENISLNGAILGMRKAEIDRNFDEIVAFAEIEKFIDTPVKHYSTGMYMRLAFAVAAHLEPEILIIDEVLAVGDAEFQKKCLGKMGEVAKGGRTVIFVSHQLNQIRRLCSQCIWLDQARLRQAGNTPAVVSAYEVAGNIRSGNLVEKRAEGGSAGRFQEWQILNAEGTTSNHINKLGSVAISFSLSVTEDISRAHHGVCLYNSEGLLLWSTDFANFNLKPGMHQLIHHLPSLPLRPGAYYLRVSLHDSSGLIDYWECVPELIVSTEPLTHSRDEWAGILNIPSRFVISTGMREAEIQTSRALANR
jgi:lipopolysaccharide transport system ATP-binding protein